MKKKNLIWLPILIVITMCMALTSCGGSDDPVPPPTPPSPSPSPTPNINAQAIDLGLPSGTLWANMNVGATAEEEAGLYFAWGETTGYGSDTSDGKIFDDASYKWGTSPSIRKYCTDNQNGIVDNKTVLELEDDAARANWGGDWRMPTNEEFQELLDGTTQQTATVNGIRGVRLTSKTNGKSIYFPAVGYRMLSEMKLGGEGGYYWSSSIYNLEVYNMLIDTDASIYCFRLNGNYMLHQNQNKRSYGLNVRAVMKKTNIDPSGGEDPEPTYPNIKSTPLTLEAIEDGAFTFRNKAAGSVTYRIDGGAIQTIPANSTETINVTAGQKVRFFGDNAAYATSKEENDNSLISGDHDFYVYGNIMSLVNSTNYATTTKLTAPYTFTRLFENNTHLKNHPSNALLLPATTLTDYCYSRMFYECKKLTSAPELPAKKMANYCYEGMFLSCIKLTSAPELPATTLAGYCYSNMFNQCESLTSAPELPATKLAESCYRAMFHYCRNLTSAPELPATTLAENCYTRMFSYCEGFTSAPALPATTLAESCYVEMFEFCYKLTTAPELPATKLARACYQKMFTYCSSLTTAPVLPATTLEEYCYDGMFRFCYKLTTAPELPATKLTKACYQMMFSKCTNLTTAPVLPATTLADYCYCYMFRECSNLKYVKCLAIDMDAEQCTYNMFEKVWSTGTFVKAAGATWSRGYSGIPSGWTIMSE